MKKIFVFAIGFIFLLSGVALAADSKIGIINIQKIIVESKAGKEAKASFQRERDAKQGTLSVKDKEVKQLEDELKNKGPKMKAEDRRKKEETFAAQLKDLARLKQDLEDDLKKKDMDLTTKVVKDIFEIVQKVGKDGKYTVILQAGPPVIYIDNTIDITNEVLRQYDQGK